uniref:CrcB family protein n=1 Tax=Janibacter limosus TaxID=53458 RepID=A0AC61U8Y3_9MICO|nr:CrcB family protein [Janibacter limosus]
MSDAGAGWRWSTLTVNLTGALVMGLLVAWLATRSTPSPLLRPFVAVGVLGGWTTYSGFALDTHAALDGNDMIGAVGYVLATIVLGVGASLVGLIAGERWFGPPPRALNESSTRSVRDTAARRHRWRTRRARPSRGDHPRPPVGRDGIRRDAADQRPGVAPARFGRRSGQRRRSPIGCSPCSGSGSAAASLPSPAMRCRWQRPCRSGGSCRASPT